MTASGHYFDCNATTPLCDTAREAWLQASAEHWHNPSSLYRDAGVVRRLLEEVRVELSSLLEVEEEELVFTSGATEANNAVLAHAAQAGGENSLLVISSVEHPSVREPAEKYFGEERLRELAVDEKGMVCLEALDALLSSGEVGLVSIMAANNETGVIQPWREAADICRQQGVMFHCDAAQWIGKMELEGLNRCDFLTGSGHKFGAPKGVGFLRVSGDLGKDFHSQLGGPQEEGMRAGTEDYPGVVAMMTALKERQKNLAEGRQEQQLRDRQAFESLLMGKVPEIKVVAAEADRLWNTVMLVLPEAGPVNLKWLIRLDRLGFAVSTGSACSAGKDNPSRVMEAMGLDFNQMGRVLRISGGWDTQEDDWNALADALQQVWEDLS